MYSKPSRGFVHPYIPNSVPEKREKMLKEIGISTVDELFSVIPERLKLKRSLKLPDPLPSEYDLERHVRGILSKDRKGYMNFLGGGCWQHYVPAVCDEIISRPEFLTAYVGEVYSDFGKWQAYFEFASELGELLDMDVVSFPTYSWGCAAGNALRMASRITGRREALVPEVISPERLSVMKNFCDSVTPEKRIEIKKVKTKEGMLDVEDLKDKISDKTACVYFENPSYLGVIEEHCDDICNIAREKGSMSIAGVDPISLGILAPPGEYGADIAIGSIQPLGIHMYCGGGTGGFIASRDEERIVNEYPSHLYSITDTVEGEYGFGECTFWRTSYESRDRAKDWVGTAAGLWTIASAVYMALMGPKGFMEIGETIMKRSHYCMELLSGIDGIEIPYHTVFKEFPVRFAHKNVKEVNKKLLEKGIIGGKDLSGEIPGMENTSLYCVTEIHTKQDIEKLARCLREVVE